MKTERILLFACLFLTTALLASAAWAAALPADAPTIDPWQPLTPPPGSQVTALAVSPQFATDRTVFSATDTGVYRSLDSGHSWTAISTDIRRAHKIVLSPRYPADRTLFVLGPSSAQPWDALFLTNDGGITWHVVWHGGEAVDLALSPGFATDGTAFLAVSTYPGQVLRSTNHGVTWQPLPDPVDLQPVLRLAVSPDFPADHTLFAAGFGPLNRSTDGGASWHTMPAPGPNYGIALSPDFAADHTLWVSYREIEASGVEPESGVARSADDGNTWDVTGAGLPGYYATSYHELGATADGEAQILALDPSFFGAEFPARLYASFDGGVNWAPQAPLPGNAVPRQVTTAGRWPAVLALGDGVAYRYSGSCYELLADGGVETDPTKADYAGVALAWDIPNTMLTAGYADDYRHDGTYSMRTGTDGDGPNIYSYSSVRQRVTIPADASSATLTLWRYPILGDAAAVGKDQVEAADLLDAGSEVADYQYLLALHDDGSYDVLRTWRDNSQSWTETTVDLSAYAGRSIRLHFGTFNNGTGGRSGMFIDQASLQVCLQAEQSAARLYLPMIVHRSAPATATPTPSPTSTGTPTSTPSPIPTATPGFVPTPYWAGQLNLPAGSRPHGVALNAAGDRAYVAFHGIDHSGHTLGVVNEYLSLQAQIDLGPGATGPNGVAVIPSDGRVVIANRQTNNASVVEPVTGAVVATLPAGSMPDGVVVQAGFGYIANFGSDSVTVFDPASLSVVATLTGVGDEPSMLVAGEPGSNEVFLTAHGSNQVFHLRGTSVLGHWDGIAAPYGITYDAASRRLYVANRGPAHTVTVIDVALDAVVGTIPVGKEPYVLLVNPESGHLFVACGDEVKVYDTYNWSPLTSIPVPPGATEGIAFEPRLSKVFVTSAASDALTVIQDQGPARVLFSSDRDGNGEIYRMLPDGRNVQRLTFTADSWETRAVGSPDGLWIAYERHETLGPNQIWLMSRDGRNAHMLTDGLSDNVQPTWSADSSKLAFASSRDGDWEIYVLDLATRAVTRLTDNTWDDFQPDWSKINGRIAFVSTRYTPNGELFTMAADGSDVQQLTSNINGDSEPSWSPLANRLAFFGTRPAGQALYTVHSDGSSVQLLAPQLLRPNAPAWGFVGDAIVFSGYRPGNGYSEIMRIEADGSGLALLTNNEVNFDYSPGWLPGW